MPLQSMTGFARADSTAGDVRFHWELRSVNSRGLDIRLRLPSGQESLEASAREMIGKSFARGNVSATLTLDNTASGGEVRVNERALARVLSAIEMLAKRPGFDRPRPDGILALRGVLDVGDATEAFGEAQRGALLEALTRAIASLVEARRIEGERLEAVLVQIVSKIETLVDRIASLPVRRPEVVRARLAEQVQRLVGTGAPLDPDRLHQEAMLIAVRADVEEELKRLGAHIAGARGLLSEAAPTGRRLDFLAQEFNREANTICSKAIDIEMTRLGLELKAVIDQLREQVQNIE
ncbi:MAG: YicC/YloC family endoribonuclease [Hyphomicrobiaceae bacterium]